MNALQVPREITANETYKNWQSFLAGEPCRTVLEARLYTDAWITGELQGLGPYSFVNTIAHAGNQDSRSPRPAIVLRVAFHIPGGVYAIQMKDDFEHYHGGDYFDEVAAIASLFLGIRLKAGPEDREFLPGGDPFGRPIQYGMKAVPRVSVARGSRANSTPLGSVQPGRSTRPSKISNTGSAASQCARQSSSAISASGMDC